MKHISSIQNPIIKQLLQLKDKARVRKKHKQFVVEGYRELGLALKGGYTLEVIFYQPDMIPENRLDQLLQFANYSLELITVSKTVYQKIAHRETTEGIIAVGKYKTYRLSDLHLPEKHPLILVAEAPEKPGNIGALLRTADAAKLDAVLIANPKTDILNPNIIRSSVGCVFTNRIAIGNTSEILQFLTKRNINIYCAALTASTSYHTLNYNSATAIVVGTEADGLSDIWLQNATEQIIIPMQGEIDSMNVSVSAAILIFEAKRQRGFLQFT